MAGHQALWLGNQLQTINAQRDRIIGTIRAVVAGITAGTQALVASEKKDLRPATRKIRRFSRGARAKLRAAAKKRWAEAKQAGKRRLG